MNHDDAALRIHRDCMTAMETDSIFRDEAALLDMFPDPWLQDCFRIGAIFRAHSVS